MYGQVLPESEYTVLLLEVTPRFVEPGDASDYFSHEQVTTWGIDSFVGAPEDPGSPYYRTFEARVGRDEHLYEFVVPMVPPAWNDPDRVEQYCAAGQGESATAVAYSLLSLLQPANSGGEDCYELPHPGSGQMVVTSRFQLRGIPGMTSVALDGLDEADAVDILRRASGRADDYGELAALSALVGHLPLAVQLVGRRLAARPDWRIADHVGALRDQSDRLELAGAVNAAIGLTYDGIDETCVSPCVYWPGIRDRV